MTASTDPSGSHTSWRSVMSTVTGSPFSERLLPHRVIKYRCGMPDDRPIDLHAITPGDIGPVADFLATHLSSGVPASGWRAALQRSWTPLPNHGFMLTRDGEVVGVQLAFYSTRRIGGVEEHFCNLGAWCVIEDSRAHGLKLLRAVLRQPGYTFTDLSPSGNVVALNKRLKFASLDTATAALPNLPWPTTGSIRVTSDRMALGRRLSGPDLQLFRDHEDAAAANHILVTDGDETCYVIFRRDRRKRMPFFVSILYVSNAELFARAQRHVSRHLLLRYGVPVTLAELRIVGGRPRGATMLKHPRPKMFKSDHIQPDQVDYLYSELTNVAW